MPLHVAQARQAAAAAETTLATTEVGDARELAFPDASADAVLLLGPLYHLLEQAERAAALAEARRVLRPGGVLAAVAVSRFASLIEGLRYGWACDHPGIVESGLHTGTHRNPGALQHRFTTAHFARPEELAAEVGAAGLAPVTLYAVEGPGVLVDDPDEWMDDQARRDWLLRQLDRIETEPSPARRQPARDGHRSQMSGLHGHLRARLDAEIGWHEDVLDALPEIVSDFEKRRSLPLEEQ